MVTKEPYQPTTEDRERVKLRVGELLMSGDGFFATKQGEGITAGLEIVMARVHHCNLACGKNGGWVCDADYTWDKDLREFWQEPKSIPYALAAQRIEEEWKRIWGETVPDEKKRVVFTGGDPLLQQPGIAKTVELLPGYAVEIETNGTVYPYEEFLTRTQINCSPKLANSGNSEGRRYRPHVLKAIAQIPNSWFKFVVTGQQDLTEIDQIVSECNLPAERILLMPEGRDVDQIQRNADLYRPLTESRGWGGVTLRNQFIWYGDKRAT